MDADEDLAVVGALVSVVEEADVPVGVHGEEEAHQGAGAFGEFEAVELFVGGEGAAAADHVADVFFGEFVVVEVDGFEASDGEVFDDGCPFIFGLGFDADENVSLVGIGHAVAELSDASLADRIAEESKASLMFGDGNCQKCLAVLTGVGSFGDEAEAFEVDVGSAGDRDEGFVAQLVFGCVGFGTSDAEGTGRFEDATGLFEGVFDGCTDGVGIDEDVVVDKCACQSECFFADEFDCGPIGEEADVGELNAVTVFDGADHGIRISHLDADDFDLRTDRFDVCCDTGNETAAADGYEDGVDGVSVLVEDLHRDGPLPCDDVGVVEGMDEDGVLLLGQFEGVEVGIGVAIAMKDDITAESRDSFGFESGGCDRHDDGRAASEALGAHRDPLSMVAGGGTDDAAGEFFRGEVSHLVVGAAKLETEDRLGVFSLEPDLVVDPFGEFAGEFERGLDGDVVDLGVEDAVEVVLEVDGHGGRGAGIG